MELAGKSPANCNVMELIEMARLSEANPQAGNTAIRTVLGAQSHCLLPPEAGGPYHRDYSDPDYIQGSHGAVFFNTSMMPAPKPG